jgi:hypothetical protein
MLPFAAAVNAKYCWQSAETCFSIDVLLAAFSLVNIRLYAVGFNSEVERENHKLQYKQL